MRNKEEGESASREGSRPAGAVGRGGFAGAARPSALPGVLRAGLRPGTGGPRAALPHPGARGDDERRLRSEVSAPGPGAGRRGPGTGHRAAGSRQLAEGSGARCPRRFSRNRAADPTPPGRGRSPRK